MFNSDVAPQLFIEVGDTDRSKLLMLYMLAIVLIILVNELSRYGPFRIVYIHRDGRKLCTSGAMQIVF